MRCYLWCLELMFLICCLTMCLISTVAFVFFGDLVAYHGLTLPVAVLAVCGLIGFLLTCQVHYQRFYGDDQSLCCLIMVGVLFVCCGLGCLVFLASFTRKANYVGKMDAYRTDKLHKRMIDRTQMFLRCCGDVAYSDWFAVDWQGLDSVAWGQIPPSDVISRTAVPFSCCSPKARPPCVHNYLQLDMDARLYRGGCKDAIVLAASIFLFIMATLLVVTGVFMLQWGYCFHEDYGGDVEYEVVSTCTADKTELVEVSSDSSSCSDGSSLSESGRGQDTTTYSSTTASSTYQPTTETTTTTAASATPEPQDITTTQETEYGSTAADEPLTNDTETEKEMANVNMATDTPNETDRETTDVPTGEETGNDTEPDTGNATTEGETTEAETDNKESSAVETDQEGATDQEGVTDQEGETDQEGATDQEEATDQEGTTDQEGVTDQEGETDGAGETEGGAAETEGGGGDTDASATEDKNNTEDDKSSWAKSEPSVEGSPTALSEDDIRARLEDEGVIPDTDTTNADEESRPPENTDTEAETAAATSGAETTSYVVEEANQSASNSAFRVGTLDGSSTEDQARSLSVLSLKSEMSNKATDGSVTEATATTVDQPTSDEDVLPPLAEDTRGKKDKNLTWNS